MMPRKRKRSGWVMATILSLTLVMCKQQDKAPPPAPEEGLLRGAIAAQGGLEQLKAASTFSARYQGILLGTKINGTMQHKAGTTRLLYTSPTPDQVIQTTGDGRCWQQLGRVVVPCLTPLQEHATRLGKLLQVSWLWPLRQRRDRKIAFKKVTLQGKEYPGLSIREATGAELGTLLFDSDSSFVTGIEMQTTLMGETGQFVGLFNAFEKSCGVNIPTKREYTFRGQPWASEKIEGVICEKLEDKLFDPPAQVKSGTVELKNTTDSTLVCTKLKGPYSGISGALAKVGAFLSLKDLSPTAPAVLIHHQGPPRVKRPAQYVTDVCFPVGKKAWVLPESTWKGEFFMHQWAGDEMLRGYATGEVDKATSELTSLLLKEAKRLGRTPAGSMVQVIYMLPEHSPPEQRVSEMYLSME